jgi:hypothetical protein
MGVMGGERKQSYKMPLGGVLVRLRPCPDPPQKRLRVYFKGVPLAE